MDTRRGGAIRLISISPSAQIAERVDPDKVGRLAQYFLDDAVRPPFRFQRLGPLMFVLAAAREGADIDHTVVSLNRQLEAFLFGEGEDGSVDVLSFAGSSQEIAQFAEASDEDAAAAAAKFRAEMAAKRCATDAAPSLQAVEWSERVEAAGARAFRYRGVYECRTKALVSYAITPSDPFGEDVDIDPVVWFSAQERRSIAFECDAHRKCVEYAELFSANDMPLLMHAPVSFDTIVTRQNREVLVAAVMASRKLTTRSAIATVVGGPAAPSHQVLERAVAMLQGSFRFLDWQVNTGQVAPDGLAAPAMHSVTLNLNAVAADRARHFDAFLSRIPAFKRAGLRSGVSGIRTEEELLACVQADATYASGDAVTAPLHAPKSPKRISPALLPLAA